MQYSPEKVESRREFFRPAILQRQIEARRRVSGSAEEAPRINLASESGWWRWILAVLAIVWLVEPWLAPRGTRRHAWLEVATARYRAARSPRGPQPNPDAEIQHPWSDAPWSVHGRVCRARWRAAERYAARVWSPASDPGPGEPAGPTPAHR